MAYSIPLSAISLNSSGQLVFGASIASGAVSSITGTTNQVVASASSGAITLSLPQSIATTSTPTFAQVTLSGDSIVVGSTSGSSDSVGMFIGSTSGSNLVYDKSVSTHQWEFRDGAANRYFIIQENGNVGINLLTGSPATTLDVNGSIGIHHQNTLSFNSTVAPITIASPVSPTAYNLILPTSQGASNTYLKNDGSGNLSFSLITLTTDVTGVLPVANGGTGDSTLTAYSVLCGGTTTTGAVQSVASLGSSGQVLTSNGASALPTWQTSSGSGTVNSGTSTHLAYYATSTNAVSDTSAFYTANSNVNGCVVGTNTNDSATAGSVGEWADSGALSGNYPASGVASDAGSLSLTAGDWDVTVHLQASNGGTATAGLRIGISTTSGNSLTGLTNGVNQQLFGVGIVGATSCNSFLTYRFSLSGTTSVYFKLFSDTWSTTAPTYVGSMNARRRR